MQVVAEKTLFMQKAIYFVSKLIASRGIIELTDRNLNFQVSPFDASFGIRDLSVDICTIRDIRIEGGSFHPKVVVIDAESEYEFVLSKGQELYDTLKKLCSHPIEFDPGKEVHETLKQCSCNRFISSSYRYCPWCGCAL
ncbi:MAG: hypothetical protein JSV33_06670 [bacterium]|nr:MAG: hypothetical protein JSV33_06670 [bacterium]